MILRADGDYWSVAVSTSLFTSGSSINPGSSAPLLAPPPTSGSPVFLTPRSFWLPNPILGSHFWFLSLKICLSPAQMATSSCNEVKQPPRRTWHTPKVVYTSRRGLHHQPWRTPKVVYTSRRGPHHQLWRTPKVVYTISRGVHPKWPTPRGVAYTQSGLHPRWSSGALKIRVSRHLRNSMKQGGIAHWPQ